MRGYQNEKIDSLLLFLVDFSYKIIYNINSNKKGNIFMKIDIKEELDKLKLIDLLEDYGYNQETINTIVDSDKPENLVGPFNSVKDLMKDLKS